MELKAARCPSCQGDLDIPEGKKVIECPYCGTDIFIVQDAKKVKVTSVSDILKLAETELKVGNIYIAIRHYDRLLETDPTNPDAWYGKCLIALHHISKDYNSLTRAKEYFNKAIEFSTGEKKEALQNHFDNYILTEVGKLVKSGWGLINAGFAQRLYSFYTEWVIDIQKRKSKDESILELIIDLNLIILVYLQKRKQRSFFNIFSTSASFKIDEFSIRNNIDNYTKTLFDLNPEKAKIINDKCIEITNRHTVNSRNNSSSDSNYVFRIIKRTVIIFFVALILLIILTVVILYLL